MYDSSSPRPELPQRSKSTLTADAPHDASQPDNQAVTDVYRSVEETGSLEAAARKLSVYAKKTQTQMQTQTVQRNWEDDPEEAGYLAQSQADEHVFDDDDDEDEYEEGNEEGEEEEEEEVVHMQEVIEGLWIGDLVAAMDSQGLAEKGITNILSLLRPRLTFDPSFSVYPLEIDDSADTDILTHLPSCVAWIHQALEKRTHALNPAQVLEASPMLRSGTIDKRAAETKAGGVLVHCQAGMSRSATVVAAYLMGVLELEPTEAVDMLREKRPVVDPSETFWYQLGLFYNADGKVSLRDRGTRQFYMERTTSQFMNGDGGAPPMDKMAKYPTTPTPSNPPTPMGGHGRRKIRCKMCRRHLAVREHMMDHILDHSPVSRPRTPSNFALPSPQQTFSNGTFTERRASVVSDVINPLTGLPGATPRSRHASMSSGMPSPMKMSHDRESSNESEKEKEKARARERTKSGDSTSGSGSGSGSSAGQQVLSPGGVPLPRTTTPGLTLTASSPEPIAPSRLITDNLYPAVPLVPSPLSMSRTISEEKPLTIRTSSTPPLPQPSAPGSGPGAQTRPFQSLDQLNSRLPPHLLALRNGGRQSPVSETPFTGSPGSSPEKEKDQSPGASQPFPVVHSGTVTPGGAGGSGSGSGGARRMSLLQMTPTGGHERTRSGGSISMADANNGNTGGPPILVNPKCSGYFVEPLTWMESMLKNGDISGKIVCPNEKCGVKIGNFDWAGVQCGCREWVTPGFCIHRSKVDEVW